MKGYVFLSNSTKPTDKEQFSREDIELTNVSKPCLKSALDLGYNVFFGVNRANPESLKCELPVNLYDSHTYRSLTAFKDNKIAYDNLKQIVKNNDIKVIHCNTPVGGLIGRLVGRNYSIDKVIYTAHGFHFYKGAPIINNTIFKLAERVMARWTDVIITMNEEDYQAAKKFKLKKNGKVFKVHGVGINLDEINKKEVNSLEKRKDLGFTDKDILCISVGRLDSGKNYINSIKALGMIKNDKIHLLVCGEGPEKQNLIKLAKELGVLERVHFLGFRKDVIELMKSSDIFLFTSLREGLPRALMEAMGCGLPCVVSKIRGNVDLIDNGRGGYICDPNDYYSIANKIMEISTNSSIINKMSQYNRNKIKEYDINVVNSEISYIYKNILG